ncbi:SPOR domain-containing protein [Kocuria flava]|uniref:SPOR domain-containing protein n=1 Tax=Kocuria flava TaxID=446860 RepID=UPI001FF5B832|nr:SPOR domain-containing protein [Kocuria flava]MCJ8505851.1 SPOR domain-containing protein [Kocuria flava]
MSEYWFNLYTKQVEEGPQSDYRKLLGPYGTRQEAENALRLAAERTRRWDEEDEAYREG